MVEALWGIIPASRVAGELGMLVALVSVGAISLVLARSSSLRSASGAKGDSFCPQSTPLR
jgi:hypothetical protein